jgi:hypothetical protein
LTKDDFQAWRGHPVTEAVDHYLRDFAAHIREQWANGENWTDEARVQLQNLEDLADLDLESIETFYDMREGRDGQESQSEVQDSEDGHSGY